MNSFVLVWPDRQTVDRAARAWAREVAGRRDDLLVYSEAEWSQLIAANSRFARVMQRDVVWIWPE